MRPQDARRVLAETIADKIETMIAEERLPDATGDPGASRAIEPRDILILVPRRSVIFKESIRASKARGIAMAGADRLAVADELAVKDLTALLQFLATPEDNLALAAALKSPLLAWDERTLFDLAHYRTGLYLWPELRKRAPDFPETYAMLRDLRDQADFLRPYEH